MTDQQVQNNLFPKLLPIEAQCLLIGLMILCGNKVPTDRSDCILLYSSRIVSRSLGGTDTTPPPPTELLVAATL